jgi:hypothetical protein
MENDTLEMILDAETIESLLTDIFDAEAIEILLADRVATGG